MPVRPEHTISSSGRFGWLLLLMCITLLVITGFQLYWLRENYFREKKTLAIKTDAAFKETIMRLQVKKFKLDGIKLHGGDSLRDNIKIVVRSDGAVPPAIPPPPNQIISTINVISNKLKDSATFIPEGKMVISLDKTSVSFGKDSAIFNKEIRHRVPGENIINMLYGVDSMQAPLTAGEIDTACRLAFQKQKINIPFSINKFDTCSSFPENKSNEVTVGFAHPVTYKLETGNTFPWLIKRIGAPILFSLILLGITILSFMLMYRNMIKQRRLAEAKNEFISNITHELKTPIATVGVAIEALKNFNAIQDPQRTREYLDISSNELQRLSLLVDKVLKLSMFEKQGIDLKYEAINLEQLVNEVSGSLKLQTERHHAIINITAEGDLNLQGDKLHLQSVVFNLLDNALKYSKDEPRIDIDMKGGENTVVLTVADNGIGIPSEYRDKIFEKFFRIPHGDTHNAKGYGLGLSYVAQVIEKHKGTISVDSKEGSGTTFSITLPKYSA